ncbi:right-handed parallel beta-helix repeat-containing protein [Schlesneria paludicola]|uniref:right-handed parallel beta-helix repeat-containing protein n=1 Tax=Schlesneria paludicola TaxID=360056 RepID=UPI00029A51DD|nr:right-handed parallel beta-helix repeat-containing protein [Schlesneria paludicola]
MSAFCRILFLVGTVTLLNLAEAREIYVDNLHGRNLNDGLIPDITQAKAGPVRTISRALDLAKSADVIVLKNTGTPYYESISLTGSRHSGIDTHPFVIQGNGSTISGLRSIPRDGWREVGPSLWKLTFTRKGYYQILRNGRLVPEFLADGEQDPLAALPPGHWVSWRGSVYFRQDQPAYPSDQAFAFSAEQTGISLHHVNNVLITNVTLQHFRFDGLHAQGLCNQVELDNVTAIENGRAGIVASSASKLQIFGGSVARNGRHEIMEIGSSTATQHPAYELAKELK